MSLLANYPGHEGWLDFLRRIRAGVKRDELGLIAAGVAFYTMLAVFPGLAALISLWGLIADPAQVTVFMEQFAHLLPEDAYSLLHKQAADIAGRPKEALTMSLAVSVFFAFFSASAGVKALMKGLNIVYGERETRGVVKLNLVGLGLTLFLMAAAMACLAIILAVPDLLRLFLPGFFVAIWEWARWVLLFFAAIAILATLYRFAPCCHRPRWKWMDAGSLLATILWLPASALFSLYVTHYGSYNETYGSIGAVIVLLVWLWLGALAVLLGAELNAGIERKGTSS